MRKFSGSVTHISSRRRVTFCGQWRTRSGLVYWSAAIAAKGDDPFMVHGETIDRGSEEANAQDVAAAVKAHIQALEVHE
jgi:hypothetical protein